MTNLVKKVQKPYKTNYNAIHIWILRNYKKNDICEHCKKTKKTEWSNRTGDLVRDRDNWQELCKSCHTRYDIDVLNTPWGRGNKKSEYRFFAYGEYFN